MKKQLLTGAFILSSVFAVNAQQTLFEDSFETYEDFAITNVGSWTLLDIDESPSYGFTNNTFTNSGEAFSYIVFNSTATTPALEVAEDSDWTGHTGSKAMVSFAAVMPADDGNGPNNDWLISPQVTLVESGNTLSFWAKSATGQYGLERFTVSVSTTDTDPASFTLISEGNYIEAPAVTYQQYTYDLDAYAGTPVYIAIHCVSPDRFGFVVDDFKVTADGVAGLNENFASKFSVYPNPANTVVNVNAADNMLINTVAIIDINGRTVKTVNVSGAIDTQVNISDLSSGVYMINIASDKGNTTKKLIKN